MIDSLSINGFRCFENVELHGLRRINLIVGRNSSGKTALLEAMFLACGGSPELALRLRVLRGLGPQQHMTLDRTSYESLWKDLFFGFDQSRAISITVAGSPANSRSLNITYRDQESFSLPFGKPVLDSPFIVPIVFEWRDSRGDTKSSTVKVNEQGLMIEGAGEVVPVSFYSSGSPVVLNPAENASRFSALDKLGKAGAVATAITRQFPFVQGLSIQLASGIPAIYATVDGMQEKIPVAMLSGGINKLMSLLLAAAEKPQVVVLIDEIENGFYYDTLPDIWSSLLTTCQQNDAQIFASTHSRECLQALRKVMTTNESEFCLIRTERDHGTFSVKTFGGREFGSAIEQEVEFR